MVAVVALVGCCALGAACSPSSGASQSTTGSTALKIPPPFEVRQKVGLGDLTIAVDSFRRTGQAVTVRVDVTNETAHAVSVAPATAFSVFYDTGLHPLVTASGLIRPIAPNGTATVTLEFTVPTQFAFPLLWFNATVPGTHTEAIVLRGDGA